MHAIEKATALIVATLAASVAAAGANPSDDEILAEIAALRAQQAQLVEAQTRIGAAIDALEAKFVAGHSETTPHGLATEYASLDADGSANAGVSDRPRLPSDSAAPTRGELISERVKVSGDLRLRHQGDYSDVDAPARNSGQIRARLGATYTANHRLTLGGRLATGDADDPNSTDVQLSNFADDLDFALDLAYARYTLGDMNLYGGKLPQFFARTDLVWDSDVNPEGLGVSYVRELAGGTALTAKGLYFLVDEQSAGPESEMRGAQLGLESLPAGAWKFDSWLTYYDYDLGSPAGADAGDIRSNLLRSDGNYLSDFDIGELLLGTTWTGWGERWPLRVLGDLTRNFGAATSADTAFGIDAIIGRASSPGDWRITYGYSTTETDAVLAAFSHDNILLATNYRLHALSVDYVPMKNTQLSAIWYHYRPESATNAGLNAPGDWLDRLRLYFLVNF